MIGLPDEKQSKGLSVGSWITGSAVGGMSKGSRAPWRLDHWISLLPGHMPGVMLLTHECSLDDVAIAVLTLTVAVCAPAGRAGSLLSGGLGTDSESVTGDKGLGSTPWALAAT